MSNFSFTYIVLRSLQESIEGSFFIYLRPLANGCISHIIYQEKENLIVIKEI